MENKYLDYNGLQYYTTKIKELVDTKTTTYVHRQDLAAKVWVITHNLNRYPSVVVIDSGNNLVLGDVIYNSLSQLTITFTSEFSGKAYLN